MIMPELEKFRKELWLNTLKTVYLVVRRAIDFLRAFKTIKAGA